MGNALLPSLVGMGHGLTDRMVRQAKPGVLIDGNGLRLKSVANSKSGVRRSWLLRVKVKNGVVREIGLGSADLLSLADARKMAQQIRADARAGRDPLKLREAERAALAAEASRRMTFKECAEAYIAGQKGAWRSEKHAKQWTATLTAYAYPVFGKTLVNDIDQEKVMRVLDPIWATKTETASRVRQRIEAILDWATVRGHRQGENPARWKGHLERALPPRSRAKQKRHHAALPYKETPAFITRVRDARGRAARALEFCVLTATRTNETLAARIEEFDFEQKIWTIPANRMKAGREHRVPLSEAAIEVIEAQIAPETKTDWLFPGGKAGRPLSNMAMLKLLERMDRKDLTVHGFRSTFRDWAGEATHFPREVVEAALAHNIGDATERAYARGDLFEKRRKLMNAWSGYSGSKKPRQFASKPSRART